VKKGEKKKRSLTRAADTENGDGKKPRGKVWGCCTRSLQTKVEGTKNQQKSLLRVGRGEGGGKMRRQERVGGRRVEGPDVFYRLGSLKKKKNGKRFKREKVLAS